MRYEDTQWFQRTNTGFKNKDDYLCRCGVKNLFAIPDNVKEIQFRISDEPVWERSLRIDIVAYKESEWWYERYGVRWDFMIEVKAGNTYSGDSIIEHPVPYALLKRIAKLLDMDNHPRKKTFPMYLTCYYR